MFAQEFAIMGCRRKATFSDQIRRSGKNVLTVLTGQKVSKGPSERVGLCASNDPPADEIAESQAIQAAIRDGWSDSERIKRHWKKPTSWEPRQIHDRDFISGGVLQSPDEEIGCPASRNI
jgi:hypothetical protein